MRYGAGGANVAPTVKGKFTGVPGKYLTVARGEHSIRDEIDYYKAGTVMNDLLELPTSYCLIIYF